MNFARAREQASKAKKNCDRLLHFWGQKPTTTKANGGLGQRTENASPRRRLRCAQCLKVQEVATLQSQHPQCELAVIKKWQRCNLKTRAVRICGN